MEQILHKIFTVIRKPIYGLSLFLFFFIETANAQFTGGRLVVEQVGDGSAALSSASTPLFLKEFTTAGTLGITVTIPTTGGTALTSSGSATSEGLITRSSDGQFILVPGYNISSGTAAIAGTSTATIPRAIGEVTSAAVFSLPVTTTSFSANNPRGGASDGTNIWASGANSGVVLEAASGPGTIISSTLANLRSLEIFNGQLYASASSGALKGVGTVGVGTPTTTGNTTAQIFGNAGSPYEFSINPAGNIAYVADDAAGIQKWVNTSGTWALAYILNSTKSRGLVVDYSSANITTGVGAIVYATDALTTSANSIFSVVDAGAAGASSTILTTAPANTAFRGLAFTPATPNLIISGTASVGPFAATADSYTVGLGPVTTATSFFKISGTNLTNDVVITAPADYEVSNNNATSGFGSTVTLTSAGTLANTNIYFRLKAGLAATSYNTNEIATITSIGLPESGNVMFSGLVSIVLPVKISSVTASPQNNNVFVQWQVESEINVKKYEVQKSIDGEKFNTVDTVEAKGNYATENLSYNWLDINAVDGSNYYRIHSIDMDGTGEYSQIVKANITGDIENDLTVYPNPVINGVINLQISNKLPGIYKANLYNSAGQLLLVKTINYSGNKSDESISVPNNIGSGIYQLLVIDPNNNKVGIKIIL